MGSRLRPAATLLLGLALLQACANPEARQASQQAAEAEAQAEDDAKCREGGLEPGTQEYDGCRNVLAQRRAEEAAAQERRRIEFQRTLGGGTSDYTGL